MRLLGRTDTVTEMRASGLTDEDLTTNDDQIQLQQAEAEAAAAEELASTARARAEELRANAGPPDHPSPSRARRWLRRPKLTTVVTTIAVLSSAALLTATGYMLNYHRQFDHEQQRKSEFAAAASHSVLTLLSIDSAKAEDNVRQIIADSTGPFRDNFQSDAKDFVTTAHESKSATKATIRTAAVESMATDSAVVLVTAATTVSNSAGPNQRPRNWRLRVTMVKDGAQLKMSKVEFVQ